MRWTRQAAVIGAAAVTATMWSSMALGGSAGATTGGNPYAPDHNAPYRHGAVPTLGQFGLMQGYEQANPAAAAATGPRTLSFGGGIDGIGVTSAKPRSTWCSGGPSGGRRARAPAAT